MEIVITIIICITILVIVGLICYTKCRLEGIDEYKSVYKRMDNVFDRFTKIENKLTDIEWKINKTNK